jgi:hypothetical protein
MTRRQNLSVLLPLLHQADLMGNQLLKTLTKTEFP